MRAGLFVSHQYLFPDCRLEVAYSAAILKLESWDVGESEFFFRKFAPKSLIVCLEGSKCLHENLEFSFAAG
jgi:hypothetical protein